MTLSTLVLVAGMGVLSSAHAQQNQSTGLFTDASLGVGIIDLEPIGRVEIEETETGSLAGRVSVGYWFTRHWGAALNYAELGRFRQEYEGGVLNARGRSWGLTLLGRLPIGERWSFTGSLGLQQARLRDNGSTGDVSGFSELLGKNEAVVLLGLEMGYHLSPEMQVFVTAEPRGRSTHKADLGYVGFGMRWHF
ncbi:MAG: outer membrane beta-barrel protein [Gammaproteobacteria bacterium]|nr:outer membrane beta-barrel protein [Gammaproteobacteria bacterium]